MERFAQMISKNWIVLVIIGVLSIALGIFGLLAPDSLAPRFMALIGGLFVSGGVISFIRSIQSKSSTELMSFILVVLGLILIFMPEGSASFALGVLGISLSFFGFFGGVLLLLIKRFTRLGALPVISAFLLGILGLVILFNTHQSLNLIMSVGGLALIFIGILFVLSGMSMRRLSIRVKTMLNQYDVTDFMERKSLNDFEANHNYMHKSWTFTNMPDHKENSDPIEVENLADKDQSSKRKDDDYWK